MMMTDPDDETMEIGKVTCCDRFLVNIAGAWVDMALTAATGIYLPGAYFLFVLYIILTKKTPSVLSYYMGFQYVRRDSSREASGMTVLGCFLLNIPLAITNLPCCTCFGDDQLLVEHCMGVQLIKRDKK
jgi:hypothetical protein